MFSLPLRPFAALNPSRKVQLLFLIFQQGLCNVHFSPNPLICRIGEEARFKWSTGDGRVIYSVNWGIKNGTSPDSQFINTNIFKKVINYNTEMDPKYRHRVFFIGNLTVGRAWFLLKNVTKYDEKVYVANIREDQNGVFPYTVKLKVEETAPFVKTTPKFVSTGDTGGYPTFAITNVSTIKDSNDTFNPSTASTIPRKGNNYIRHLGLLTAVVLVTLSWCCLFVLYVSAKKWTGTRGNKYFCVQDGVAMSNI